MAVMEWAHVDVTCAQKNDVGALAGFQRTGLVPDAHSLAPVHRTHLQTLRLSEPHLLKRRAGYAGGDMPSEPHLVEHRGGVERRCVVRQADVDAQAYHVEELLAQLGLQLIAQVVVERERVRRSGLRHYFA